MNYDTYLMEQADKHNSPCKPTVIATEKVFEGYEEDGSISYSIDEYYNCNECDQVACEYWCEYNDCEECNNSHCEYNDEYSQSNEDFFANRNEVA